MHECPHCKQPSITSAQKLYSVSLKPAVCPQCQGQSYLPYSSMVSALMIWVLLSWLFIGIALYQQMVIYLLGTIPAFLLAVDKYMLRAPLRGLTL